MTDKQIALAQLDLSVNSFRLFTWTVSSSKCPMYTRRTQTKNKTYAVQHADFSIVPLN